MPQVSQADQARLRTIFDTLKEQDREWKESELERHLLTWQRMTKRTVDQLMRDLRRLAAHGVAPVKIHGTRYEMVESFLRFLYHRENVEHKMGTATKNDFKAILALAKYRGIPNEVFPKRAPIIKQARDTLPRPEEIHALLHAEWVPDATHSYEQHLIQYLLVYIFGFGVRAPSEAHALKVSDFDSARHLIVIREPKKSKRRRRLYIEPEWLCCGKNRPSLNQYLKWRAKVDVGGTDAFFLKPNGEPFHNELAIARFLERRVKRKFPWFHCYLGRTWNANAHLIQWDFGYERVADWLGHESVEMVREYYEQDARIHAKLYGDNWLERAFVGPRKAPRTVNEPQKGSLLAFSPVANDAAAGI